MRKRNLIQRLCLIAVLVVVTACEKASETLVDIPSVAVECDNTSNADCNATISGNRVFVIMTRSGCGASASFEPIASSSTALSCDGTGCTGLVTSWIDANNNSVDQVITGSMDICSFIDVDNNITEGTGDLGSDESENIQSSATITVDSWSVL